MATLDTSYGWVAGDVERILIAFSIGISNYSIDQMTVCCNELGEMSPTLVSSVRGLLSDYDESITIRKGLGVDDDAGKTLVKADVLEWEKDGSGGRYEAILKERGRIADELVKIFAFCPIVYPMGGKFSTPLIRS